MQLRREQLLLACLYLTPFSISAEPTININTSYYPVFGNNAFSIRQSIQQDGPVGQNGKQFHASTTWKVNWSYRWTESRSVCRLNQLKVNVDIDYLLPELKSLNELDETLQKRWKHYSEALFKHEQQHKEVGLEAARELEKRLLAIPQLPCNEFETTLAQTAQQVLDEYDALEKKFDLDTNHGINQGVILP